MPGHLVSTKSYVYVENSNNPVEVTRPLHLNIHGGWLETASSLSYSAVCVLAPCSCPHTLTLKPHGLQRRRTHGCKD